MKWLQRTLLLLLLLSVGGFLPHVVPMQMEVERICGWGGPWHGTVNLM